MREFPQETQLVKDRTEVRPSAADFQIGTLSLFPMSYFKRKLSTDIRHHSLVVASKPTQLSPASPSNLCQHFLFLDTVSSLSSLTWFGLPCWDTCFQAVLRLRPSPLPSCISHLCTLPGTAETQQMHGESSSQRPGEHSTEQVCPSPRSLSAIKVTWEGYSTVPH